jgi:hypothetical protein
MAQSSTRMHGSRLASPPPPVLQGEEAAFVQRWVADPKNRRSSGDREQTEQTDDQAPRTPAK